MLIIARRTCQFEIESRLVQQRLSLPRILGPSRLASPIPCTPDRWASSAGKFSCSIESHHHKYQWLRWALEHLRWRRVLNWSRHGNTMLLIHQKRRLFQDSLNRSQYPEQRAFAVCDMPYIIRYIRYITRLWP